MHITMPGFLQQYFVVHSIQIPTPPQSLTPTTGWRADTEEQPEMQRLAGQLVWSSQHDRNTGDCLNKMEEENQLLKMVL